MYKIEPEGQLLSRGPRSNTFDIRSLFPEPFCMNWREYHGQKGKEDTRLPPEVAQAHPTGVVTCNKRAVAWDLIT
jgi:hypothetical protein